MIYTITFNPALDYIVSVKDFRMGMTNRTESELLLPGGKGINVTIVLSNLGVESTALGFIAGFTGREIDRRLKEIGCMTEFIEISEGTSRINVKLKNSEGTEINSKGPAVDETQVEMLKKKLEKLTEKDMLVLAGSIPVGISETVYREICEQLGSRGVPVVVDAAGDLLLNVLPTRPFLVKPNNHELGDIFGVKLRTAAEVVPYAKKLQEMGARNVLVSMAGKGAVLADENGCVHTRSAPEGTLVNSVGAGDSMVAGFLAGYLESKSYEQAFKMGVAAGSASAFSEYLASGQEVEALMARM